MRLLPAFLLSYFLLLHYLTTSAANSDHYAMHHNQASMSYINQGDNLPDIIGVRRYLHRYGYLQSPKLLTNQQVDDYFDENLEKAILSYQKFFKLDKTGVLDNETVTMMLKPRCGNLDIVTKKKKAKSRKHFTKLYQIFPGMPHRTKNHLYVDIQNEINLPQQHIDEIYQAFVDWERFVPIKFIRTSDPDVVDIEVHFFRGAHGDNVQFDGPNGILAHASLAQGSTLHFDSEENWQIGFNPIGYDIRTVARHEIGHLLGLGHSDVESSLMYPTIPMGVTKEIGDDDIAGIMKLYTNR